MTLSRVVTADLALDVDTAWRVASDPVLTAGASDEVQQVRWVQRSPGQTRAGDVFAADMALGDMAWTSASTVTVADRPTGFAFAVGAPADPTATWTYRLEPTGPATTRVAYEVVLGTGPSMLGRVAGGDPIARARVEQGRLDMLAEAMAATLSALPDLAKHLPPAGS